MDPLTALGLAASVVQFVSFASDLVSKSKEIYTSAKGCTTNAATLELIYTNLGDLSSRLEASSRKDPKLVAVQGSENVNHVLAINDLAGLCKKDCDDLLKAVHKLQGGNAPKNRWQSFALALRTVWRSGEIADLEQRLHHVQTTLTLHICALTSYWNTVSLGQLKTLRSETADLDSRRSAKLDDIAKRIDELSARTSHMGSLSGVKLFGVSDILSLQTQMSQLSVAKTDVVKEHTILKSLSYVSLPVRYSAIPEAHHKTFGWVFKGVGREHDAKALSNLHEWLQNGDGFFWVSGKPGSGKSTLMKSLTDDPRTLRALSTWSHPRPAIIARHFFWSAGTPMQKSWQGLLQALLYDIFRQLPDQIELACAERWAKSTQELEHEVWRLPELRQVLRRIADSENLSARFCFFIDGLDEFDGDHLEFNGILRSLSKSPHIKLCISSRPWNVFEDSFGRDLHSKLYMHELTRDDIRSYVESMLQEHPKWNELDVEDGSTAWLTTEIMERATGVFLWVFLVVRQLRNGLTEYDSFSDLRRRLENIPTDLETFFKQILDSVEPFYHEKMATTLQIALAATQPAHISVYGFHDEEYEDEDYALKLPTKFFSAQKNHAQWAQTTRRLNGRCRGLLEVFRSRVEFLHRTVMDFLKTPRMLSYLREKAPAGWNAHLSLIRAFTAYIKTTRFIGDVDRTDFATYTNSRMTSVLKEVAYHAGLLDGNLVAYRHLDELACCIRRIHRNGSASLRVRGNDSNPVSLFFWEPVIEASLGVYLRHALARLPAYFDGTITTAESFMIFAMLLSFTTDTNSREQVSSMYKLLADNSHPHRTYGYSTKVATTQVEVDAAWTRVLQSTKSSSSAQGSSEMSATTSLEVDRWELKWVLKSRILCHLLTHGANPNISIPGSLSGDSHPVWMNFVLSSLRESFDSHLCVRYLETLDWFIAAGANIHISVAETDGDPSNIHIKTGLALFLDHLSTHLPHCLSEGDGSIDHCLICWIAKRLMVMCVNAGEDVHRHWPALRSAFCGRCISYLAYIFSLPEGEAYLLHPVGDVKSLVKRRLADPTDDEAGSKKVKGVKSDQG